MSDSIPASADIPRRQSAAAAPRDRWWHVVAAMVAESVLFTFRKLPAPIAYGIADLASLGLVAYTWLHEQRVGPKGRGLFRNQRIVFRELWTPRFGRRLLFRWARHMTHLFVDFSRMPSITRDNVHQYVNVDEIHRMLKIERNHGALCVTGHMGCWELSGYVAALLGFPVHSVARPLGIPALDDVIRRRRTGAGQKIIAKHGALRRLRRVLASGEVAGLVADEMNPQNPIFVPFLGTRAAMNPTLAKMHLATRAPIVVATVQRVSRRDRKRGLPRYRYRVWEVIRWQPRAEAESADDNRAVEEVSRRVNDAYSRAVLSYPEQWLWGSRRFHVRPPGETMGPDGLPPAEHSIVDFGIWPDLE